MIPILLLFSYTETGLQNYLRPVQSKKVPKDHVVVRPPIFYQKPAVIKDTGAAAASSTQPPGWPGFQVPKEYIHAREGVGNRIPEKEAEPVSAPASKPRHQATKRHVPQYSPKR